MSDVRAAERVLEIVNRPNIVDNIDRWYEIEPLAKALANAYLAEHPADESLDVDEDWLVQIGFQPDASGALWIGDYRLCWFGQGFFGFDGVEVEAKTRGDVRRMCRVFGVEAK